MNPTPKHETLPRRVPHRIAMLLVAIVFPLIWVGGLVTTYDAGMAVPDWPGTYGYNMFAYPIETWLSGPFDLLVEHGHRLLGSLAGLVSIALMIATWKMERRAWVRWFSLGLFLLVIFQGLLGGMRVLLDARTLAKIHGCVGPAFFVCTVAFCVVTSRWWHENGKHRFRDKNRFRHPSSMTTLATMMLAISYGQLVVGAFLRHIGVMASPNQFKFLILLHIVTAITIILGTLVQWITTRRQKYRGRGIRGSINVLMVLILVQFLFGIGTWVVKFGWPHWFDNQAFAATFVIGEKSFLQMNLITAHVAVGSLILAYWAAHALRCYRTLGPAGGFLSRRTSIAASSNLQTLKPSSS